MNARITLKDISKNLNISISTVSRALKGHPDISEETREKVMRLASLMEYEPNTYAISLRTNKSNLFGIIVPEISNYFYHSFIASVEEESRKIGFSLLILQSGNDPAVESENLRLCRLNRVAGIFVAVSHYATDRNNYLKMEENGIPVIFFDKVPAFDACNKVCLADEQAASLAARELVLKEKKHVLALFGNEEISITRKRKKAFLEIMAQHPGLKLDLFHTDSSRGAFRLCREKCGAENPPDAVFCMSDEILTGVMKALQQLELKIPDTVGVISISNDSFIPHLYQPEITYVETSGYKLGKLAFQRVREYLDGKRFYRELTLPAEICRGQSL